MGRPLAWMGFGPHLPGHSDLFLFFDKDTDGQLCTRTCCALGLAAMSISFRFRDSDLNSCTSSRSVRNSCPSLGLPFFQEEL